MLSASNAYATKVADYVLDVPMKSSQYDFVDEDVPFYQIVFKGTIPLASQPVTMSGDADKTILKAIETGMGLTFALSYDYSNEIVDSQEVRFYGSNYSNAKELIKKSVEENSDYYNAVKGAKILNHYSLTEEVKVTEFDNGVEVYVNYSDFVYESPFGSVEPKSYIYSKGGSNQ